MCRVDYAEPCDVFNQVARKARYQQSCGECGCAIMPGSRYEFVSMLYEGHWSTARTCLDCFAGRDWLTEECGGYIVGEVLDELLEHHREGEYGEQSPITLLRLIVGMQRRNPRYRIGWNHG